MSSLVIQSFFDSDTATFSYIIYDQQTSKAAIIDPVLNYDPLSGEVSTKEADILLKFLLEHGLSLEWILETHIHADHLTAAHYIREKAGGKIGIGSGIHQVLCHWVPIFNISNDTPQDGSQFDHLFADGETFSLGNLTITVLHTPGHTPSCVCYWVEDAVFVGDLIFMPDIGTARTDFPGGDARALYHSIHRLYQLPDHTRIFTCHDYPPQTRSLENQSTIAAQKLSNVLINTTIDEGEFVRKRVQRDTGKPVPRLLLPALQINLRAGSFGKPENNGIYYIKIPVHGV